MGPPQHLVSLGYILEGRITGFLKPLSHITKLASEKTELVFTRPCRRLNLFPTATLGFPVLFHHHQSAQRKMASSFHLNFLDYQRDRAFFFRSSSAILTFIFVSCLCTSFDAFLFQPSRSKHPFGSLPKSNSIRFPFSLAFSSPAKSEQGCMSPLALRKAWLVAHIASSTIPPSVPRAEKTK